MSVRPPDLMVFHHDLKKCVQKKSKKCCYTLNIHLIGLSIHTKVTTFETYTKLLDKHTSTVERKNFEEFVRLKPFKIVYILLLGLSEKCRTTRAVQLSLVGLCKTKRHLNRIDLEKVMIVHYA